MKFTQIPEDTFNFLQMNAGVILTEFDPATATLDKSKILCATTGGVTAKASPTYSDLGDDIDNAPKNVKELKHLDEWECTLEFTALTVNAKTLKMALGAADIAESTPAKVTPRNDLKQEDFADIWWVGDLANGAFVAVKLSNALSTDGISLQSNDNGKGQTSIKLTGHYSLDAQDVVPMEFYVSAAA